MLKIWISSITSIFIFLILLILPSAFGPDSHVADASIPPSAPKAQEVPSHPRCLADLIEGSTVYNGKQITVEGEVVGDIMIRGSRGWVNLTDGSASIGVWGPTSLIQKVKLAGGYKARGDWVRVTGTFWRSDSSQGGELDIQASALTVTSRGKRIDNPVTSTRIIRTIISIIIAAALGLLWMRSSRSNRP